MFEFQSGLTFQNKGIDVLAVGELLIDLFRKIMMILVTMLYITHVLAVLPQTSR